MKIRGLMCAISVAVLLVSSLATAQKDTTLTIKGGVGKIVAKGYIGGEAHDRYAISVSAGRKLRISLSSHGNRAHLTVSESGNYSDAELISFGTWTEDHRSWSGLIPRTGFYYIYVTAHPTSTYKIYVELQDHSSNN